MEVKKTKTTPKVRNVCFTINNYTLETIDKIKQIKCTYLVFGEEIGEKGTHHLQGYVEFANPKSWTAIEEDLGGTAHMEKRFSTAENASEYCKKEGKFIEIGELSRQGHRSDLESVAKMIKDGIPTKEIAESNPVSYIRYTKGIEALHYQLQVDRTEAPIVIWLWGPTGVGKTRTAFEAGKSAYIKDGTLWWDGYDQQEVIIIDDFDGHWPFRDLLRLLDRYPYQGQRKGSYVKINSPKIFITCDKKPSDFWQDNELAQILRRITNVIEMCLPSTETSTHCSAPVSLTNSAKADLSDDHLRTVGTAIETCETEIKVSDITDNISELTAALNKTIAIAQSITSVTPGSPEQKLSGTEVAGNSRPQLKKSTISHSKYW